MFVPRHHHARMCCGCRFAPEKVPYGIERYTTEVKRLLGVLEDRLKSGGGPFIMGDTYTIAGRGVCLCNVRVQVRTYTVVCVCPVCEQAAPPQTSMHPP